MFVFPRTLLPGSNAAQNNTLFTDSNAAQDDQLGSITVRLTATAATAERPAAAGRVAEAKVPPTMPWLMLFTSPTCLLSSFTAWLTAKAAATGPLPAATLRMFLSRSARKGKFVGHLRRLS